MQSCIVDVVGAKYIYPSIGTWFQSNAMVAVLNKGWTNVGLTPKQRMIIVLVGTYGSVYLPIIVQSSYQTYFKFFCK